MGKAYIMRRGGASGLNLNVVMQQENPVSPKENTIWVRDETALSKWAIAPTNPFTSFHDVNIIYGAICVEGFFSSSGAISAQDSTKLEWYTENYFNVDYGTTYEYHYSLSSSNSQWLAICEYKSDETFIKRIVLINSVTGTETNGTYTPSSADVSMIRLCWRSFGDNSMTVELIERNVEYTLNSTEYGSVWIRTMENYGEPMNVTKNNIVKVYPATAMVYKASGIENEEGIWMHTDAFIYRLVGVTYMPFPISATKYIYLEGSQFENLTGGWVQKSGTLTVNEDSLHIKGSSGRISTTYPIDTTGFNAIEFDILASSSSAATQVGIGTSQTAFVSSAKADLSMTDYATVSLDVSNYQGMYYVQIYTTASTVGCYVKSVRVVT